MEWKREPPAFARKGAGRSFFPVAAAVLAALLSSLGSLAQAPSAQRPPAAIRVEGGSALSAGQVVRVTWDALPPDTEEFELLLRCDLPRPLVVRLTESEDPRTGDFLWRVPSVPCLGARLLLRRGEGGEESLWAQSETFLIRPEPGGRISQVAHREGELWLPEGEGSVRIFRWGAGSTLDPGLGHLPEGALDPTITPLSKPSAGLPRRPQSSSLGFSCKAGRGPGRPPATLQLRI